MLGAVRAGGKQKAQALLDLLAENPYQQPTAYEALVADLRGACSRRINIQHRLVYQVQEVEQTVKVLRMWTHYQLWRLGLTRRNIPAADTPLPVSRWGQQPARFPQLCGEQE